MADCIFNGTTKRPPMGLAEVTITMEDPELAEAARFVLESAAEETGPNTESTEVGSTEGTEKSGAENIENSGLDLAQDAAPLQGEGAPPEDAAAGPEFVKGKRRKKVAEKPALVMKPGEVVVSRRLYRSGQSEYLINGRVARLRDIQEMFMGVGLGPDSYAIIEQGRIGLILSTKPLERRAIIEEAAGVT
jgi:chromosome segregation protein